MHHTLTQRFSHFLHRRRNRRHFERKPLLHSLVASRTAAAQAGGAAVPPLGQALLAAAHADPATALATLRSQAEGLDAAESARRLAQDGPNEIQHEPPLPGWLRLWHCCRSSVAMPRPRW